MRKPNIIPIVVLLAVVLISIFALLAFTRNSDSGIACTQEAKLCADGSAVGRNSSNGCEFDPCPTQDAAVYCTPEMRQVEICTALYQPICGWFDPDQVQCVRYPCAQTYTNACDACANEQVLYYTQGECPE